MTTTTTAPPEYARVTQQYAEVAGTPTTRSARITQQYAEVAYLDVSGTTTTTTSTVTTTSAPPTTTTVQPTTTTAPPTTTTTTTVQPTTTTLPPTTTTSTTSTTVSTTTTLPGGLAQVVQAVVEAVRVHPEPAIRVPQQVVEVARDPGDFPVRTVQSAIEVVRSPYFPAQVAQAAISVVRKNVGRPANKAFVIFRDVQIEQGAELTRANIFFTAYEDAVLAGLNCTIYFAAVDDVPQGPQTLTELYGVQDLTTGVPWTNLGGWVEGETYVSPNLVVPLMEVINRPGWTPGNNVMAIIEDDGSYPGAIRSFGSVRYLNGDMKCALCCATKKG